MSNSSQTSPKEVEETRGAEMLPTAELVAWTALISFGLTRWVNGPPVSGDQFVMHVLLASSAIVGIIVCGFVRLRNRYARSRGLNSDKTGHSDSAPA